MAEEIKNEETGETRTMYSQEEYTALETEKVAKETELIDLQKINATRATDFTAYSKMTEEQKKTFDANTTTLLKREEGLVNEVETLKTTLATKEEKERTSAKTSALNNIHGGDEATKTKVEAEYALLTGMPETTPEEIAARARKAATLAGIQIDPQNPLYASINGEAPKHSDKKEFVETPEGAQAAEMVRKQMGIPEPKK